jgi:hypothetical protein
MTSGLEARGRFGKQDFVYLSDEDAYRCPAGEKVTVCEVCGNNTASPCIRSGAIARYPDLPCTSEGKTQRRRDPST